MNTIAIYAVVVLTLFLSGFGIGHHLEAVKFDTYKASVVTQSLAQQKLNETTITQFKQVTKDAETSSNTRVAAVHAFYKRMRQPTPSTNSLPQAPTTSSIPDATPTYSLPAPSRLAEDCAVTTVNFITLQEWAIGITK